MFPFAVLPREKKTVPSCLALRRDHVDARVVAVLYCTHWSGCLLSSSHWVRLVYTHPRTQRDFS